MVLFDHVLCYMYISDSPNNAFEWLRSQSTGLDACRLLALIVWWLHFDTVVVLDALCSSLGIARTVDACQDCQYAQMREKKTKTHLESRQSR